MLKRFLSLFLSIVMVLSAVPFQVFATEIPEEAPETVQVEEAPEAEVPAAEEVQPEEAQPEAPEVTEPEVAETEAMEPEASVESEEPAETEIPEESQVPQETEAPEEAEAPEETEIPEESEIPEETEAAEERQLLLPPASHTEIREETLTQTEEALVIETDKYGNSWYRTEDKTSSITILTMDEVRNYPAEAKSIIVSENNYIFETFADLKELCSRTYSSSTSFLYEGEDPLVITEDIAIPNNVSLNFYTDNATLVVEEGVTLSTATSSSRINAGELYVYGTFIDRGWSSVESGLYVYGLARLYCDLSLGVDAVVEGMDNIVFSHDSYCLEKNIYASDWEMVKEYVNKAYQDTSGIVYTFWLSNWNVSEWVLTESIVIPENARIHMGTLTIADGATLEINSKYLTSFGNVVVHGNLVNNSVQLSLNSLTISDTGSYSGTGVLYHNTFDPEETLSDWLSGLDLSNYNITENRNTEYSSFHWVIQDVSGMPKLAEPQNPHWDKHGRIIWTTAAPNQGHFNIIVYKENGEEFHSEMMYFSSEILEESQIGYLGFCWMTEPESGTYYFTIQSIADNNNYANSDIVTSDTWEYVKPKKRLGTATDLSWDWPNVSWTVPDGDDLPIHIEILYSAAADEEPRRVTWTYGNWGSSFEIFDSTIQYQGTGYYYFRVRPLSEDITKICNGTWSELSAPYYFNAAAADIKEHLDSISKNDSDEAIRESVQSLDTRELKSVMLAELGGGEVMDKLEKLEDAVGGAAPVQVSDAASAFDADKISIVGANLNDAAENSSEPITLVVDKPKEEHILDAAYDNSVAVSFSMTLDNAADAENLEVPVKVTLPVPETINPDFLVILHYKQNGEVEELTLTDVHVFRKGNTVYASFVLDSFSDFVMTNLANDAIAQGVTGSVTWQVTGWGNLVLSGEGGTAHYWDGEDAPWTAYADRITNVVIEQGVAQIGARVFSGLNNVTEITIPEGVEMLYDAFDDCLNLQTVYLPASVGMNWGVGYNMFSNCPSLENIYVAEGNPTFFDDDGVLMAALHLEEDEYYLHAYPVGRKAASYTVPDYVSGLDGAFRNTRYLEEVVLQESLLWLSGYDFYGSSVKYVHLPDSLEWIPIGAFESSALETVLIPASVTDIGYNAFTDCTDLRQIRFQGDVPAINMDAFVGVEADAYYPADNETWTEEVLLPYGGNLTWHPSAYVEITGGTEVMGGKSLKLTAAVLPDGGGKVTWSLGEEGSEFVKLSAKGNTATLTAVDVTELRTVTVIASGEEGVAPGKVEITIVPQVRELKLHEVWTDEDGEQSKDLSEYEWWYWTLDEGNREGFTMQLVGHFYPDGSNGEYTWSSSNTKVATIDEFGLVTFTGKAGSVTFTLTMDNGTKASVLYKVVDPISSIEAVGDTELHLVGGKSTTLKLRNAETGKAISGKNVQWSLWMEDDDVSAYASISSSGKLTTKKVVEQVTFFAYGDVLTDGVYTGYMTYEVTLYPATTHVELYSDGMLVNDQTLLFDIDSTESLDLAAEVLPDDAMDLPVKAEIYDKAGKYASYRVDENGVLQIEDATGKTGTVNIKAIAQDGSKKTASVRIQFGRFAKYVDILNTETELISGKSLTLKAGTDPENVTKKGITWSLANPADKAYVKLSGSKLTALNVTSPKEVTLIATSKDGQASAYYTVTIVPKEEYPLQIINRETGEDVTNSTIYVDLTEKDRDIYLDANASTNGNLAFATWTVKGSAADYRSGGIGGLWVYMQKTGTVTVTAKSGDRTAKVTIKAANMAWTVDATVKKDKDTEVASGKTLDLQAAVTDRNGRPATSKRVTWSIVGGEQFAKVSSSGKVTAAKNLTTTEYVTVRATAADGSGVYDDITIAVKPLATGIKIYTREADAQQQTLSLYSGDSYWNRSNTSLVWDMGAVDGFRIYSTVYPYSLLGGRCAIQEVTWKSSSPKVASVDEDGRVSFLKPGTTTITCTAADGSGQKISFKLTVVKRVERITLPESNVVGGKSISLKPSFEPVDATNKKLTWGIYGDTAFAKIDQKGKLTTKKVTSPKTVWVWVRSQDGSEVFAETQVTIWPKAVSKVDILHQGEKVTGKTITASVWEQVELMVYRDPAENTCMDVTWKSSDPSAASVDEYGTVTVHKAGKTVTITATMADGSGKKATVKIKTLR